MPVALQTAQPHQVVCGQAEEEVPADAASAAEARLAQETDRLEPAEDALDAAPGRDAHRVAGMAGGAPVDGAAPFGGVLGDVRGDALGAQRGHEVGGVVRTVGGKGRARSEPGLLGQSQCRRALGVAVRLAELTRDRQAGAVLHEHVPQVRKTRLVARSAAEEPRLGVRRRAVRVVAPPLTLEVRLAAGGAWPALVDGSDALLSRPRLDERAVDAESARR